MNRAVLALAVPVTAALLGCSCGGGSARPASPGITVEGTLHVSDDFERDNPKWRDGAGRWVRRATRGGQVLAQVAETSPWAVRILEDRALSDVDVSVRFRPVSGSEDASGGIVFRARDARNYFLVRANALEGNFRLYTMVDGRRTQIDGADVEAPAMGTWHTMRVVAKGDRIQAYLDGKLLLDHRDTTFAAGYLGLWTKADSVTEFDDLDAGGTSAK